jgi:hypothetical protein
VIEAIKVEKGYLNENVRQDLSTLKDYTKIFQDSGILFFFLFLATFSLRNIYNIKPYY